MNETSDGGLPPQGAQGGGGPRPSFTDAQRNALWNIPRITGALSVIGSCLVLYMLFKSSRHGLKRTQNRLLFAISVVDIPFSLMFVLGPILMPSALPIDGTFGNSQTCAFQGSMIQIGYAQPIYNAFLMAYYAITVCGGATGSARDEFISKWLEPSCHVFAILFGVGTAITGLVLGIFNPSPTGRCSINSFPMGCVENPGVACQRGENHRVYKWAFDLGPTLVSLAGILLALAALSFFVIRHERNARKNSQRRSKRAMWHAAASQSTSHSSQVVIRALLYAFIFLNTYSWITAANLIRVVAHTIPPYWLVLLGNILQPFQGFFNFLLYFQPRYIAVRKCYEEWPCWRICCYAFRQGTASLPRSNRASTRPVKMFSSRLFYKAQRSSLSVTRGSSRGEALDNSDEPNCPEDTRDRNTIDTQNVSTIDEESMLGAAVSRASFTMKASAIPAKLRDFEYAGDAEVVDSQDFSVPPLTLGVNEDESMLGEAVSRASFTTKADELRHIDEIKHMDVLVSQETCSTPSMPAVADEESAMTPRKSFLLFRQK